MRNHDGQLAVVRTPRACFLPGGGIDGEETAFQSVVREVREECGLVVEAREVLGRAVEIVYSAEEHTCFEKRSVFVAAERVGQAPATESDHTLVWLRPDEALSALSHRSPENILLGEVPRARRAFRSTL